MLTFYHINPYMIHLSNVYPLLVVGVLNFDCSADEGKELLGEEAGGCGNSW